MFHSRPVVRYGTIKFLLVPQTPQYNLQLQGCALTSLARRLASLISAQPLELVHSYQMDALLGRLGYPFSDVHRQCLRK